MKTVREFHLDLDQPLHSLQLPEGFVCVNAAFDLVRRQLDLWVEVPLRPDVPEQSYRIKLVASGQPVPLHYHYVASALHPFESRAVHLYQVTEPNSVGAAVLGRAA
ncbi:MAG: hypothetical protein EA348_04700 [Pseudomonadaceae bacterium]|nr:MAG: hypothetical protein EA348_04700 [Pseudomonadaceae bacterium]